MFRFSLFALIFISSLASAVIPNADFTANNLAICTGNSTTFTSSSTGTITSYSWNFGSGASPAAANSAGPHLVTYSTAGMKTVTLTVSGPDGSSTMTKTNYIAVGLDRIKLMSYNVLNYGTVTADTALRNPYFRTIMAAADPDVLVVNEMTSLAGMTGFLNNILNATSTSYAKGTFINGPDSDNGLFYKTSKFSFISNTPIETDLRDITEFKIVHTLTGDTLRIYSVHLKADAGGPNDPGQRALEVDSLRKVTNALPAGTDFVVCGDFNIYGSTESAYQKLIADSLADDGNFIDPLTLTTTWNNQANAIYHTQCTRDTALGSGGASGGMNDRFDMILYSTAIGQAGGINYVPGSTIAYGNDGAHWNKSIYIAPNNAVGSTIATALYNASDHLPVILNLDYILNNCQSLDLGVMALVNPITPTCSSINRTMTVRIKNLGFNTIDFSAFNATVNLQVTKPSAAILNFSMIITSGTLAPSATMDVTFNSTLDMSSAGNYIFNSSTVFGPDANQSNNSMPASTVSVSAVPVTTISPPGPLTICGGTTANLAAANGNNYQWSSGQTTQTISISTAGNYSVNFTDLNGCLSISNPVSVSQANFQYSYTVVSENMGIVSATTAISTHETNNGFQNVSLTMSGSGDVRSTTASSGYATASGGANIFLTNQVGKDFIISGINSASANNLQLSFGIFKTTTASNGSELLVKYSTDNGANYSPLTFPLLQTGSGTAVWSYVYVNELLPAVPNLRIQFIQNGTTPQFRIDDILLVSTNNIPVITPQGPTSFCPGGSVTLNSTVASSYLWSNGLTTQNITVNTTGNYSVIESSANGCTASSAVVPVNVVACSNVINLKLYIDGYYSGGGFMRAVADTTQTLICDTLRLQLASTNAAHTVMYEDTALLHTNGTVSFNFPGTIIGNSYYLVIRHRSALTTWSGVPVLIDNSNFTYDFNDASNKAFGSNQKNLNDGNFALYIGDVNQDGSINYIDYNTVDNALHQFITGYLPIDLNGDYQVESVDFSLMGNNLLRVEMKP